MRGFFVVAIAVSFSNVVSADIGIITHLAKEAYTVYKTETDVSFNRCLRPVAVPNRFCDQDEQRRAPLPPREYRTSLVATLQIGTALEVEERLEMVKGQTLRLEGKVLSAALADDLKTLKAEQLLLEEKVAAFSAETLARLALFGKILTKLEMPLPEFPEVAPFVLDESELLAEKGVHLERGVSTIAQLVALPFQKKNLILKDFDRDRSSIGVLPSPEHRGEYLTLQSHRGWVSAKIVEASTVPYALPKPLGFDPGYDYVSTNLTYKKNSKAEWTVKSPRLRSHDILAKDGGYVSVGETINRRAAMLLVEKNDGEEPKLRHEVYADLPPLRRVLPSSAEGFFAFGQVKGATFYLETDGNGKELRRATFWTVPAPLHAGDSSRAVRSTDGNYVVATHSSPNERECVTLGSFEASHFKRRWEKTYCADQGRNFLGEIAALTGGRIGLLFSTHLEKASNAIFVILNSEGEEIRRHETGFLVGKPFRSNLSTGILELLEQDAILVVGAFPLRGKFLGRIQFFSGSGGFLEEKTFRLKDEDTYFQKIQRAAPGRELLLSGAVGDRIDPDSFVMPYPTEFTLTFEEALAR